MKKTKEIMRKHQSTRQQTDEKSKKSDGGFMHHPVVPQSATHQSTAQLTELFQTGLFREQTLGESAHALLELSISAA